MPTLYAALGVDPDADERSIVRAYREQVKTAHPDVTDDPDAQARFKRLTTARDVLTDETERARYDRLGHEAYVQKHLDGWNGSEASDSGDSPGGETVAEAAERMAKGTESESADPRSPQQVSASDGYATAAEYYRPGQRVGVETRSGFGRTLGALRDVLPWLLAHLVLLCVAVAVAAVLLVGTGGGGLPSLTSVVVATALVGTTGGVSVLHLTSTVYR
ncbi:DnaJ domain-containing protein [Haloarcula laminariae]|uniref:DnaJ domain-containing protein n=1 Tax=Haloarcula laminariae TaxID=2961577 RepID=UPI0021C6A4A5|nr:DnaJ domain-containing protein [Halomicroarcula laminariae]